jgi:hypothetical protein
VGDTHQVASGEGLALYLGLGGLAALTVVAGAIVYLIRRRQPALGSAAASAPQDIPQDMPQSAPDDPTEPVIPTP